MFRSGQNKSGFQAVGNKILSYSVLKGPLQNEINEIIDSTMKVKTLFWKKIFFNSRSDFAKSRSSIRIYSVSSQAAQTHVVREGCNVI